MSEISHQFLLSPLFKLLIKKALPGLILVASLLVW
ncbi:hypothetical protein M6B38_214615 [Iris pallida]|uniref:NADH dehydrogenase subunit 1 n=1 Tax=Iris pallida TaxID=29817 RepID=A0AAX6E1E2_IRIPA|nr:hypothetical protein M6B38_214615 [Iris pallida]